MYKIVLMRHGRSLADDEKKHEGRYDSPLTDIGRQQALHTADKFRELGYSFDKIISSPLIRAYKTAEIVNELSSAEIITQPLWMEKDNGLLAGRFFGDEVNQEFPVPLNGFSVYDRRANGTGESLTQVYARGILAIDNLLNYPEGSYLVVAHGGILNAALKHIFGAYLTSEWEGGVGFRFADNGFMELDYSREKNRWVLLKFDGGYNSEL